MTIDLTDAEKLELANELLDEVAASKALKDSERLRVPMFAMDAKSIQDANAVYGHRPGYRMSGKLMKDGDADREAIIDAHEQYDREISEKYKHTNPEPVINTPAAPVLDSEWDEWDAGHEREQAYLEYDQQLQGFMALQMTKGI